MLAARPKSAVPSGRWTYATVAPVPGAGFMTAFEARPVESSSGPGVGSWIPSPQPRSAAPAADSTQPTRPRVIGRPADSWQTDQLRWTVVEFSRAYPHG